LIIENNLIERDLLFEVQRPIRFRVRVTRTYWELIVSVKHPVMARRELDVKEALANPDEIRRSRRDSTVFLFYKSQGVVRWLCAVTKRLNGEGFLITTYLTDTMKEGVREWPK